MNIKKLFERVEELEKKNEVLLGKFKAAASLLQKQNERIKKLEESSSQPSHDPYVSMHSSNMQLVTRTLLLYMNGEHGFATFLLPDGRGFAVSESKWSDPRVSWGDLVAGKKYEELLIHRDISVDEPINMKCYVEERYEWKWRVQWKGKWGNIYTNGLLNEHVLDMHIRERYPDDAPRTSNGQGDLLKMELELMVLPWYVKHAGWNVSE